MNPKHKRARAGIPDTGSSSKLSESIPTAAELQGQRDPALALTKQAMRLEPHELLEFIGNILIRFPHLKKTVAALCETEAAQ